MELEAPKAVWIAAKHFNAHGILTGTITRVRGEKGKYGTDYIVTINSQEAGEVDMTMWGSNYNYLYNTHGHNPKNWEGKPISIIQTMHEGKPRRVVS